MYYKKIIISLCIINLAFLNACSSSPPECGDSDVQEVLSELLYEQGLIIPLSMPYAKYLLTRSPEALSQLTQGNSKEAFDIIDKLVSDSPESKYKKFDSSIISAAKTTSFTISGMTTTSKTEQRTSCEFTVKFKPGLPSAKELGDDKYIPFLNSMKTLSQDRKFETYYSDDGELYVSLEDPD